MSEPVLHPTRLKNLRFYPQSWGSAIPGRELPPLHFGSYDIQKKNIMTSITRLCEPRAAPTKNTRFSEQNLSNRKIAHQLAIRWEVGAPAPTRKINFSEQKRSIYHGSSGFCRSGM